MGFGPIISQIFIIDSFLDPFILNFRAKLIIHLKSIKTGTLYLARYLKKYFLEIDLKILNEPYTNHTIFLFVKLSLQFVILSLIL